MRERPDVVVVGAGVMGAWTALLAQRAGYRTLLLDAYGAGHPRATSGDETRIIRASHGPDRFLAGWSRRAMEAWLAFEAESRESLHVRSGVLWLAGRDDGFEVASEATLRDLGVPVERLTPDDVAARWPQIGLGGVEFALFEPEAGLLMARRAVAAVVRAFVEAGGRFDVRSVRPGSTDGGRLVEVVDDDGRRIAAGSFVFACGPWLPRLFPDVLGRLIRVTKQDVLFFGPPGGDGRFAAEWLPCWVEYDASFYGVPAVDGRGVKLAPDRYGPVFDPSHGDRLVDPETVRLARAYLERRFPDLAGQPVVETRVCQYETTPDTQFVIDRHPGLANAWLVGGGSGHGFKHGPLIGATVVARLGGERPGDGEERFAIGRSRETDTGLRTGGDSIVAGWQGY